MQGYNNKIKWLCHTIIKKAQQGHISTAKVFDPHTRTEVLDTSTNLFFLLYKKPLLRGIDQMSSGIINELHKTHQYVRDNKRDLMAILSWDIVIQSDDILQKDILWEHFGDGNGTSYYINGLYLKKDGAYLDKTYSIWWSPVEAWYTYLMRPEEQQLKNFFNDLKQTYMF